MSKKNELRPRKTFIEGMDSYCDEYRCWKKTQIIKRLVGVFEVPEVQFRMSLDDLLGSIGYGHYKPIQYSSEYDNSLSGKESVSGSGCAVAVRDVYDRIVPIVFVRSDVRSLDEHSNSTEDESAEFCDSIRLLVLMHELGHADDIIKEVNYDHEERKVNFAAAEAYAHSFVCRQAQKHNYPLLLNLYLENVDRMASSENDAERVGAERFLQSPENGKFRSWLVERNSPVGRKKFLNKSGRLQEIKKWSKSS